MFLSEFLARAPNPTPWAEGDRIPWGDPEFSERMLHEHLSQDHDAASRRSHVIDSHVRTIHSRVLQNEPSAILDLGCGPGLYAIRLARLGHSVTGVDISPASIRHARGLSEADKLNCRFIHCDMREIEYGGPFNLVMQIFGETNTFHQADLAGILVRCHASLRVDGRILLEVDTPEFVRSIGESQNTWRTFDTGLFLGKSHIYLTEYSWDVETKASTTRFVTIDADSGEVRMHASTQKAYSQNEISELLSSAGFREVETWPALSDTTEHMDPHRFVVIAVK